MSLKFPDLVHTIPPYWLFILVTTNYFANNIITLIYSIINILENKFYNNSKEFNQQTKEFTQQKNKSKC